MSLMVLFIYVLSWIINHSLQVIAILFILAIIYKLFDCLEG